MECGYFGNKTAHAAAHKQQGFNGCFVMTDLIVNL